MNIKDLNNLYELFCLQSKKYKNTHFLHSIRKNKSIESLSWYNVNKKTESIANFLFKKGVKRGDRIMLVSEGRPEWMISDLAIIKIGAITVPNYTTYTQKDFEFVLKDCQPKGLIVSNDKLYKVILNASKKINFNFEFVISFDQLNNTEYFKEIENNQEQVSYNPSRKDPACIIYTSGTQGNPKGVILSHGGILANCEDAKYLVEKLQIKNPRFLTWLPLSHSYEHTVQFVQISLGAKVYYSPIIEQLLDNIKLVKPHVLTAVPRFYNNLYNKMQTSVKKASNFKKAIFYKTIELGKKKFNEEKLAIKEKIINKALDILVRKKIISSFGGNLKAFVSGGGPLDKNVGLFLNALGLKTLQGYGLTETSPVVSCNPVNKIKIDTVGTIFSNNKVKISNDGEILVKGENVMLGYWNNHEATKAVIKNEWLHTGDIGEIDDEGYLKITDRKKDIIVTVGGDNISPSKIENLLCLNNDIEQAYVEGDNQKYLVCLLVLNKNFNRNDEKIKKIIEETNKELTQIERIKKFEVIKEEFTINNELLTPTMKIRRHKIKLKYKIILENFYKH